MLDTCKSTLCDRILHVVALIKATVDDFKLFHPIQMEANGFVVSLLSIRGRGSKLADDFWKLLLVS